MLYVLAFVKLTIVRRDAMSHRRIGYVLLALLIAGSGADAADIHTLQNGDWSDTATWDGGVVPTSIDTAYVDHNVLFDTAATKPEIIRVTSGARVTLETDLLGQKELYLDGGTFDVAGYTGQAGGGTYTPNFVVTLPGSVLTDSGGGGWYGRGNGGYQVQSGAHLLLQARLLHHGDFSLQGNVLVDADAGGRMDTYKDGYGMNFQGGTLTLDHANLSWDEEIVTLRTGAKDVSVSDLYDMIDSGELQIINGMYEIASDGTYTTVTAVPEPSALVVLGLGLAGLAVRRRRRKQLSN